MREQLIAEGAIRPAGHGKPILRIDALTIIEACAEILHGEGPEVAGRVVENPGADPRVRAALARELERRAGESCAGCRGYHVANGEKR